MSPTSGISSNPNFVLYSGDQRDPKAILRRRYDERFAEYKAAVAEIEAIQLGRFIDTDDMEPANDENRAPSSCLSQSYRELPTYEAYKNADKHMSHSQRLDL